MNGAANQPVLHLINVNDPQGLHIKSLSDYELSPQSNFLIATRQIVEVPEIGKICSPKQFRPR